MISSIGKHRVTTKKESGPALQKPVRKRVAAARTATRPPARAPGAGDSSLARMLGVLDLFSTRPSSLTVDEIALRLGVPKSTGYRYVQELIKVGLLIRLDRSITLGPRIIELDRCIRECDPVLNAAILPMQTLARHTGLEAFISKLYGHSVISIHTGSDHLFPPAGHGRGRPMPITKGSSSKGLVAFLPAARLRRLHSETQSAELPSWEEFYESAQQIRRAGYCRTSGELFDGKTGITAPIFGRSGVVVASITVFGDDVRFSLFNEDRIAQLVINTAQTISAHLSADEHL